MNQNEYTEQDLQEHLLDVQAELKSERGRKSPDAEYLDSLEAEAKATREELERVRDRRAFLLSLADSPAHQEAGAIFEVGRTSGSDERRDLRLDGERSKALRQIERHADLMDARAADGLDRLVRKSDRSGIAARWLNVHGSDAYDSAFGKLVMDPTHGHLRLSPQEVEAVRLSSALMAERSMAEGTTTAGGFAVPVALDPSVLLSSDGALSPIRGLARVITIATNHWKGVSSDGVSASFAAESAEVADGTLTLAQPEAYAEKAHAFVPFSIEVDSDWNGLRAELARLFADARATLEAAKFLDGAGHASQEPEGILTGLAAGQEVVSAGSQVIAIADAYSLLQAIPPRFASGTVVLGAPAVFDEVYRWIGGASTEPAVLPTRDGAFLGRRKAEWADMSSATTTGGEYVLLAGDVRAAFAIVDRIGMQVELIPHLVGANHRPTGERGLHAYWRVGSAVVVPEALRVLKVKA